MTTFDRFNAVLDESDPDDQAWGEAYIEDAVAALRRFGPDDIERLRQSGRHAAESGRYAWRTCSMSCPQTSPCR
jgi:hypothetical protein